VLHSNRSPNATYVVSLIRESHAQTPKSENCGPLKSEYLENGKSLDGSFLKMYGMGRQPPVESPTELVLCVL